MIRKLLLVASIGTVSLGLVAPAAQAAPPADLTDAFDRGGGNKNGEFTLADCPVYRSEDRDGQRICTGEVPSFDGTPLDVDLTLPDNSTLDEAPKSHELMVMLHGFGNDKREWESKTSDADKADKWHWNSHWFAEEHGYYVLTYTARGFHTDGGENPPTSCPPPLMTEEYQPCTPGGTSAGGPQGQIRLKHRDYEVKDTQYLSALAAASFQGINPEEVGVSGGSYGGGESWTQASQAEWTFPNEQDASLPVLQLQVALPKYPWTDLAYSLAPNGHPGPRPAVDPPDRPGVEDPPDSSGYCDVEPDLDDDACYGSSQGDPESQTGDGNPVGVMKQSYVSYFSLRGNQRGVFDPIVPAWITRVDGAGEPYLDTDPVIKDIRRGLTEDRSSYYQDEQWKAQCGEDVDGDGKPCGDGDDGKVAIFSIQGWTDDLFPAVESFRQFKYLKKLDPQWPVSLALADVGHPRAQNRPDTWRSLNNQAWQFLQSNIGEDRKDFQTGVSSQPLVCRNDYSAGKPDPNDPNNNVTGSTPEALSNGKLTVTYEPGDTITSSHGGVVDPNGPGSDPIVGEAARRIVPRPDCPESKSPALGGYTGYSDELEGASTYVGLGSAQVKYVLVGQTAQLDARVWDVTPSGREILVTRGTYRIDTQSPSYDEQAGELRLPLFGSHYRLRPGHKLRLDLTQVDQPFLRPSNLVSSIAFQPPILHLPTRETGTQELHGTKTDSSSGGAGSGG